MIKVPEGYRLLENGETIPKDYFFHPTDLTTYENGGSELLSEWAQGYPEGQGNIQGKDGYLALRIVKVTQSIPNCPQCNGQTEMDGEAGYDCHFCGHSFKA